MNFIMCKLFFTIKLIDVFYAYCTLLIVIDRAKLEREYGEVKDRVFSKYPSKFPADKFTLELFLWAFIMLVI